MPAEYHAQGSAESLQTIWNLFPCDFHILLSFFSGHLSFGKISNNCNTKSHVNYISIWRPLFGINTENDWIHCSLLHSILYSRQNRFREVKVFHHNGIESKKWIFIHPQFSRKLIRYTEMKCEEGRQWIATYIKICSSLMRSRLKYEIKLLTFCKSWKINFAFWHLTDL